MHVFACSATRPHTHTHTRFRGLRGCSGLGVPCAVPPRRFSSACDGCAQTRPKQRRSRRARTVTEVRRGHFREHGVDRRGGGDPHGAGGAQRECRLGAAGDKRLVPRRAQPPRHRHRLAEILRRPGPMRRPALAGRLWCARERVHRPDALLPSGRLRASRACSGSVRCPDAMRCPGGPLGCAALAAPSAAGLRARANVAAERLPTARAVQRALARARGRARQRARGPAAWT